MSAMSTGQKIMEGIINSNLFHAKCADDENHCCIVVWSSGAAEQIEALASGDENLDALKSCRDHWKKAFQHEREKVIRLSNQIHAIHGNKCICTICDLVRMKGEQRPADGR